MDLTPEQLTRAADAITDKVGMDASEESLDRTQVELIVQTTAEALWPGWTGQPRAPLAGPYQLRVGRGDDGQWTWRLVLATESMTVTVATSEPYGTEDQAVFMGRLLTGLVPA